MPVSAVVLDNTIALGTCLSSVSQAISVPGLTLSIQAVIQLLKVVQTYQNHQEQWAQLALRAGLLLLSLHEQAKEAHSQAIRDNLEELIGAISYVEQIIKRYATHSWFRSFLLSDEITGVLKDANLRIDRCVELFQIESIVDIREYIRKMRQESKALFAAVQDHHQRQMDKADTHHMKTTAIVRRIDQNVTAVLSSMDGSQAFTEDEEIIPRARLELRDVLVPESSDHLGIFRANHRNRCVVVRRYGPSTEEEKAFRRDLRAWQSIWHPSLPQLIGRSKSTKDYPFIVLSGMSRKDIALYMNHSIVESSKAASFVLALTLLEGIASGLDYVRKHSNFTSTELMSIANIDNMFMDSTDRAIIGRDILIHPPDVERRINHSAQYDMWMGDQFWAITNKIISGGQNTAIWSYVGGLDQYAHLRSLLSVSSWNPTQSLSQIYETLQILKRSAAALGTDLQCIPFSHVTDILIAQKESLFNFAFCPKDPWDVHVLDVGFVQDGVFVKLDNLEAACSTVQLDTGHRGYIRVLPEQEVEVIERGSLSRSVDEFFLPLCG
ncbi:hypothetical protein B0H16DRAFT_1456386 [Mycena metata]|uniref:Protein kinase domain-containing protein n=1 Tax=Mycena metata TaxID=1033252 RepID=A0AAD7NGB7_9AGAR|nr:hypothetical protein B0H16DRAFT_1456386 [Mycena metata]